MTKENISESSSMVQNSSKMLFRKNKTSTLRLPSRSIIDYKNPEFLRQFISEGGRILPSRITNLCAKDQRALKKAIKQSRMIALLPFVSINR